MNNERRKRISEVIEKLHDLKADIFMLQDEEQEAFDNMPDNIRDSDKGQLMEAAIDDLTTSGDAIDEAIDTLESIE